MSMDITAYDGAWMDATLLALGEQALADVPEDVPVVFIGIRSRGSVLAERLVAKLRESGREVAIGHVDITLYRDDIAGRSGRKPIGASDIGFDLTDWHVVLVDDVLYTARTIRAALTELMDFGRPSAIRLLVLIDRGGRELPIQPDYVGARISVGETSKVRVLLHEYDDRDAVVELPA